MRIRVSGSTVFRQVSAVPLVLARSVLTLAPLGLKGVSVGFLAVALVLARSVMTRVPAEVCCLKVSD